MGALVSVIIINWNGEKFLPDCFESIKTQSYQPLEMILVDNASVDDSLAKLPKNIELIKNTVNQGFCIAANQGIRKSRGEFIILLNQDVILHRDFIKNIIGTFIKNETIGIISGKILRMDGKTIDSTGQFMNRWCKPVERGYNKIDRGQYDEKPEIFSACGAAACYRRKMLEDVKIGAEYFDEDYFAFYEDLDLGWRAQLKGWKALYNSQAFAYHYRGGTNKKKLRFQILGRPKDVQLKIIFNRHLTIIKNISKIHFLLYFPFLLARSIIDLFFILFYNREFKLIIEEIKLTRPARGKRAFVQAGRLIPDKYIRKFII